MLFPWNCFINAGQYFKKKLQETSYTDYIGRVFLIEKSTYMHIFTLINLYVSSKVQKTTLN